MKYIKVSIQIETDSFLTTTNATFDINKLISIEYGGTMQQDELKADLKKVLSLIGDKNAMITFYLQSADSYPYTTLKGHRYVKNANGVKFAPWINGMFENWHNVDSKHIINRVLEYVMDANELMLRTLRTQATTQTV